ncbi:hypothetical protein GCM10010435_21320 [Winogradskya consettensis]|uniref:Lipoprotein n=1 Tax=Winogradskya consettensis TaxID=113560 RepID=A0A919S8M7_9ACTN|nr:hypothetical protein [Actinoplanes consettensis]GIM66772.1 hypothetical protein Aco04nite_03390 [Actinoplanes consettensis]
MRHRYAAVTVAAITLLGVAACSKDDDKDAGAFVNPDPAASSAAPVSEVPESAAPGAKKGQAPVGKGSSEVLAAGGLGPYLIGVGQKDLSSAKLVGKVTKKGDCATSAGLSKYDTPALAFSDGKLKRVTVTSTAVSTQAGAKVGTAYDQVKALYPKGKQLDDWIGASAWYTVDGKNALLFRIDNGKVAAIMVGEAQTVQFYFTDQQGC